MDVESPYSLGGIDNAGPALAELWRVAQALVRDPIFLALVGCALVAWLVVKGPSFRDPPPRNPYNRIKR